ncbi:hypothetical protein [Flavobacterium sp. UBA7680]|uniref:hypothetical protein n=1 Tax=Flavobacterium sp. UBA7680 TaxID=1946559 RepID=UPI0025C35F44|nr:hypothetical protein [Flavobacterium sp. UBA7680]
METIRKNLLRIHGVLLILIGISAAINTTVGVHFNRGLYHFLYTNKLAFIGLFQAYLLVVLIGIVLWLGSQKKNRKKWNRIGCLFHFFILILYVQYWDFFISLYEEENTTLINFTFHLTFFSLELWAGFAKSKKIHT